MFSRKYPTTTPNWKTVVKRRSWFFTISAYILAATFGYLIYEALTQNNSFQAGEPVHAVFAAEDIAAGTKLRMEMIEVINVSKSSIPSDYYISEELLIGKVVLFPLVSGEVIIPQKMAGVQGGIVAQRCPINKWCVNIPESWFIASLPDIAVGDKLEIATVLPGKFRNEAGYIASQVQVIEVINNLESLEYTLALDNQEALSLLYAYANQYRIMAVLLPSLR